ncbi:MAG: adenylate/guanylate cyclase domain-containing protein [Bacteroidia bacterium]
MSVLPSVAKGGPVLDSLMLVWEKASEDSTKVEALLSLSKYYFNSDPLKTVKYGEEALKLSEEMNYKKGAAVALKNIGIGHYIQGDLENALLRWESSREVFEEIGDKPGVANILSNQGAVYFDQGSYEKAMQLYLQALKVAEETGDKLRIATLCINIGAIFSEKEETFSRALQFYNRALPISEELEDQDAIGTVNSNIGEIYTKMEQYDSALHFLEKAIIAYEGSANAPYALLKIGDVYIKENKLDLAKNYADSALATANRLNAKTDGAKALHQLGIIAAEQDRPEDALGFLTQAVEAATEAGARPEMSKIAKDLARIYATMGDFKNAYHYQKLHTNLADSLMTAETNNRLAHLVFGFEMEKKEVLINLLKKENEVQELEKNFIITGLFSLIIFLIIGFFQMKKIRKEKHRSENLLLNILPAEVADELKQKGRVEPRNYDRATIIFTDFQNFTGMSEQLSAREVVEIINHCFAEFDRIVTKYGLEKIKTIGDAYMAVGGLTGNSVQAVKNVVMAGLEMQRFIANLKSQVVSNIDKELEMRVGIHTGAVVAGVVGVKKFQYDIWGDSVNTASRLETAGKPGKVNISETTYSYISKDPLFAFEERGMISAKNKGAMRMYFVEFQNSKSIRHPAEDLQEA